MEMEMEISINFYLFQSDDFPHELVVVSDRLELLHQP